MIRKSLALLMMSLLLIPMVSPCAAFDPDGGNESIVELVSPSDGNCSSIGDKIPLKAIVTDATGYEEGLFGCYYSDKNFKNFEFSRKEKKIDFDWGRGSPDPSIRRNTFSIVWTGRLYVNETGKITFYTASNDGSRLFIDGMIVVDNWGDRRRTIEKNGTIFLEEGPHDIKIVYYEDKGNANINVSWMSDTMNKTVIPEENLYHSTPISNYPVNFYVDDINLSPDSTDEYGFAISYWDTSGYQEGEYEVRCKISDYGDYKAVKEEDNATVWLVDKEIDVTLRGRRFSPEGGAGWTNITLTGGRIPDPTLSKVYDIEMDVDLDGSVLNTSGKCTNFFFLSYNWNILKSSLMAASKEGTESFRNSVISTESHKPIMYLLFGLWVDDNILGLGVAVPSLYKLLFGNGGVELWFASSAKEEEPFLGWLSTTGIANEMENLSETYPEPPEEGNIVEFCTMIVGSLTGLIRGGTYLLSLIDNLLAIPQTHPIIRGVIYNALNLVKSLIYEITLFSGIALREHPSEVAGVMNATAERLPDILGPVNGTSGASYIMKNIPNVDRPVLQSFADSIKGLLNALLDGIVPKILPIIQEM